MDNERVSQLNPDLEEIRNKVIQEHSNRSGEWIERLIEKTSRIHAGFLFEDIKSLQKLCLFVGECQNKVTDPGWQAFGYHLGLNPSLLKVINHNNFNREDPTYNILLAFVQYEEATIGKIIKALWDLGRLDVISRLKNSINDLADTILQLGNNESSNSSKENSDYGSQQMSNERDAISSGSDFDTTDSGPNSNNRHEHEIIRPATTPPAPFIFQNITATPKLTSLLSHQLLKSQNSLLNGVERNNANFQRVENCCFQTSTSELGKKAASKNEIKPIAPTYNINNSLNNKKKYGKIVMLTFASDGEKYVPEICKILRREREFYPRMGVLVLSEHVKDVLKDPQFFITGAFHQVDYVCPILTDSYFNIIRRKEKVDHLSDLHLDSRYAHFIYSLMNNYYVSNGCLNDKIRCILPDEFIPKIEFNLLMTIPIFSTWVKLSEVDEMAVQLLKSYTFPNFEAITVDENFMSKAEALASALTLLAFHFFY